MVSLLELPADVLIEILSYLDYRSLSRCTSVSQVLPTYVAIVVYKLIQCCKSLFSTTLESSHLLYTLELGLNVMKDTGSGKPHAELLRLLRERRTAWEDLNWRSLSIARMSGDCQAYELVAGVFSKSDGEELSLHWLPSSTSDGRAIVHQSLGLSIRDFAIDTTQDLVVILEDDFRLVFLDLSKSPTQEFASPVVWGQSRLVRLHFRTVSDNKIHPQAHKPFVDFEIPRDPINSNRLWSAEIQLAEHVLALFMFKGPAESEPRALIWDWKDSELIFVSSSRHL